MSVRAYSTLVTVSETMFPGITSTSSTSRYKNSMESAAIRLGNQVVSSLPLQMVLYLNVIYFPFWLAVTMTVTTVKYHLLNYLYKFVLVTVLVAVIIIEVVRLYLGYLGNLTEKVPELAGFWLLTILLQLPLQGFLLLNTDLILVPLERAAGGVMMVMVIAELVTGFMALREITRHQASKFHLQQFIASPTVVGYDNIAYAKDEERYKVD